MKWWTANASFFWRRALPSLVFLFIVGSIFHTWIVPPGIYPEDFLILVPLASCVWISIRSGRRVDALTRCSFGLLQGIILIFIYSNFWSRNIRFGDPMEVFWTWVLLTVAYALLFGSITHALSVRWSHREPNLSQCAKCGYLLKGLIEPRCPECGTPFDPDLLAINRVDTQEPPQHQQGGNS